MNLFTLIESIPEGNVVLARCRSWNPLRFVEIQTSQGEGMIIRNPITGKPVSLATDSAVASDWELYQ